MELGFDACAFTHPGAIPKAGERLKTWLEMGSHGDMVWMGETAERRADPSALWPEVQSIIMLGMNYGPAGHPLAGLADTSCGNISVYARGRDYHEVIKGKLKQLGSFIESAFATRRDGEFRSRFYEKNPLSQDEDFKQLPNDQNLPRQDGAFRLMSSRGEPPLQDGDSGEVSSRGEPPLHAEDFKHVAVDENPPRQDRAFAKSEHPSQATPPSQSSSLSPITPKRQTTHPGQGLQLGQHTRPSQPPRPSQTPRPSQSSGLSPTVPPRQTLRSSQGSHPNQTASLALKVFVDTAPVMEKPLAEASGLGWQGKHTNLVSQEFGSWLFLGAIFTSLPFEADKKAADHCGTCRACLDICPTSAFPQPYQLDARRCISYLTIEHKGHIPLEFRKAIGNRIYGCDDCLAVCPWNKFAQDATEAKFYAREVCDNAKLSDLLSLDDAAFRSLFSASPVKRIGHARFMRNVLIAAGNSNDEGLADAIIPKMADASPLVRAMAVWALGELLQYDEFKVLHQVWHGREQEEAVASEWSWLIFNESTFLS